MSYCTGYIDMAYLQYEPSYATLGLLLHIVSSNVQQNITTFCESILTLVTLVGSLTSMFVHMYF